MFPVLLNGEIRPRRADSDIHVGLVAGDWLCRRSQGVCWSVTSRLSVLCPEPGGPSDPRWIGDLALVEEHFRHRRISGPILPFPRKVASMSALACCRQLTIELRIAASRLALFGVYRVGTSE